MSSHTNQSYRGSLGILTALFFMWGLITSLNDILVPHLKTLFHLSFTQASLVQFCFFFAYFVMSYPAGKVVGKFGYKIGIIMGLLVAAIGCVMFYPAAAARSYNIFLFALFVLASGLTLLQVSANPYVNLLGAPETAASRLNMTQAFNSLGTTVGPIVGGMAILSVTVLTADKLQQLTPDALQAYFAQEASSVQTPYLILTAILVVMSVVIGLCRLPVVNQEQPATATKGQSLWNRTHLVLGVVGIFAYVGAEVSIGSYLISLLESMTHIDPIEASKKLSLYWGGAMVGRFIGSAVMAKVKPGLLLGCNALIAVLLVVFAITVGGTAGMWAILAVGLFNSIMFPTIFSLALHGLGHQTSQGSGYLCMGIVGGALIPFIQGAIADHVSLILSFIVPMICYVYIAFYGLKGSKPVLATDADESAETESALG